ncbi:hypothetical protein HPB51_023623 [Rhipicephalus microplus]|uniref:Uncharacterized protein n=1 Tax=Rhipicephalus microplus TaxID=6941 RepID=A0A9J6DDL9_RHIMP|nr:hypothetical protein HPB51_023623 [Rhipicephalus microplus]
MRRGSKWSLLKSLLKGQQSKSTLSLTTDRIIKKEIAFDVTKKESANNLANTYLPLAKDGDSSEQDTVAAESGAEGVSGDGKDDHLAACKRSQAERKPSLKDESAPGTRTARRARNVVGKERRRRAARTRRPADRVRQTPEQLSAVKVSEEDAPKHLEPFISSRQQPLPQSAQQHGGATEHLAAPRSSAPGRALNKAKREEGRAIEFPYIHFRKLYGPSREDKMAAAAVETQKSTTPSSDEHEPGGLVIDERAPTSSDFPQHTQQQTFSIAGRRRS